MSFSLSPLSKTFLVFSIFLFVFSTLITIWRLVDFFQMEDRNYSDIILGFVLLVNLVFFLYHAIKGTVYEIREDLFAFIFATLLLTFYEVYQFITKTSEFGFLNLETIFYVRFFGVIFLSPTVLLLVFFVIREFGWRDFKIVGSDVQLLQLYRQFNRLICLLEIDLQLVLSLVTFGIVGFIVVDDDKLFTQIEAICYVAFAVISVIWTYIGYRGAFKESKTLMIIFFLISVIEPLYIIYYIINFALNSEDYEEYDDLFILVIIIGVVALAFRITLIVVAERTRRNFGKGLKQRVFEKDNQDIDERSPLNVDL